MSRQEQALRYLDLVWAEQQGFGCWAVGRQGRFVGERYEFSEGLSQRFEAWPPADESHRASLARRLVQASNVTDIFVAPLVRSSSVRVKGSGLPGQFLYADLDRPRTPEQDQLLTRLLGEGRSFRVHSGRHQHVYIEVEQLLALPVFTDYNRRLTRAFNGDSKWDDTALLRLPGTMNHKGRARNQASYPVSFEAPR